MDSPSLLEELAEDFWHLAGCEPEGAADLESAASFALPVEITTVPHLCLKDIAARMKRLGVDTTLAGRNRRLRGCLIAYHGSGLILIDADDPADERRFTLAHELAHFLLDYQAPRQRALEALGEVVLPVLDGLRPPTLEERLHAVLADAPLGVLRHLMERPDGGLPAGGVLHSEERADRLALELLAPEAFMVKKLGSPHVPLAFHSRLIYLTNLLANERGLPPALARAHAHRFLQQRGGASFRDWLLGTDD